MFFVKCDDDLETTGRGDGGCLALWGLQTVARSDLAAWPLHPLLPNDRCGVVLWSSFLPVCNKFLACFPFNLSSVALSRASKASSSAHWDDTACFLFVVSASAIRVLVETSTWEGEGRRSRETRTSVQWPGQDRLGCYLCQKHY